jgi:hypothetical protein
VRLTLRRLATAGNAVALALLAIAFANGARLFGNPSRTGAPAPAPAAAPRQAARVLLVVIDGLGGDDLPLMPRLTRWAAGSRLGSAAVDSWIPSTVAGVRTLVEGTEPPPASFLQDFGTGRSRDGGIFAAAQAAGLRAFVAGPRLWADLYRPWLAGSFAVPTVGHADGRVLRAGLAALDGGYDLVVVHLSAPDDEAHLHGGASLQRKAALGRADAALGELLERAGPRTAVLVTSDHGTTDRGGHAGPEPEVASVPVVARGPGLPATGGMSLDQKDIPGLLLAPLGLALPPRPEAGPGRPLLGVLLAAIALACGVALCRRLPAIDGAGPPSLLNAALWITLALAAFGPPLAAALAALSALAAAVFMTRGAGGGPGRAALPYLAGLALGGFRCLDGEISALAPGIVPEPGSPLLYLASAALGIFLGRAIARGGLSDSRPWDVGILCVALPPVVARLLGETASLSTLDVRLAFRLADGPLGLPGAVMAAALVQALPALALLAGLSPALARSSPEARAELAKGMGLALLGQATAAALAMATDVPMAGPLGLGLLCRLFGETAFLFLGSAAAVALQRLRPGGGRLRPLAATPR